MEKTELMKRYEKETGKESTRFVSDGIHIASNLEVWHYEYIDWLENKVLKVYANQKRLKYVQSKILQHKMQNKVLEKEKEV